MNMIQRVAGYGAPSPGARSCICFNDVQKGQQMQRSARVGQKSVRVGQKSGPSRTKVGRVGAVWGRVGTLLGRHRGDSDPPGATRGADWRTPGPPLARPSGTLTCGESPSPGPTRRCHSPTRRPTRPRATTVRAASCAAPPTPRLNRGQCFFGVQGLGRAASAAARRVPGPPGPRSWGGSPVAAAEYGQCGEQYGQPDGLLPASAHIPKAGRQHVAGDR